MSSSIDGSSPVVTLSNGVKMPVVAVGTAPLMTGDEDSSQFHPLNSFAGFLPEQAYPTVYAALEMETPKDPENGSPVPVHIDTALYYRTHSHIRQLLGNALATGKKRRSDIFLTTKVFHPNFGDGWGTEDLGHCMPLDPNHEMTYDDVYKFVYRQFQQSLHECGVGYFDLVLLHWPGRTHPAATAVKNAEHRLAAWNVLEDCYAKGWARSIGVSNFSKDHLEELQRSNEVSKQKKAETPDAMGCLVAVRPQVNQIEASVFLQYTGILDYCRTKGIAVAAYSPLGRGVTHVTNNAVVQAIATKHGKDAGQVAMKYLFQKGFGCVVFWTSKGDRVTSNHDVFDFVLEDSEMASLDGLNRSDGSGTWGLIPPHEIL